MAKKAKKTARKKTPKVKAAKAAATPARAVAKVIDKEATKRQKSRAFAKQQAAEFKKRFPR